MGAQLILGLFFALAISALSRSLGFLTLSGSAAQFLLGWLLLGFGGWQWTIPMLAFFLSSSLLSLAGSSRKREARGLFEKEGSRDAAQVLANGGVAGVLLICRLAFGLSGFYFSYIGAVAAANADTWGTEVGLLFGGRPRLITTFREVERGRSGGITAAGTSAGFAGALFVGLSALPWSFGPGVLASAIAGGVLGTVIDSLAGATVQAGFRCEKCGKLTERRMHCGARSRREHGFRWLGNDATNLLCTATGAVAGWCISSFLQEMPK